MSLVIFVLSLSCRCTLAASDESSSPITGGGVTAGIDFGLLVAQMIADEQTARAIQLSLEYDPQLPSIVIQ